MSAWILLVLAGIVAGVQNALAGGGSFVTLGALIFAGLDPRAANITSTIALFPGQVATGFAGRRSASGAERLSFEALLLISLAGGIVGAVLLLSTPPIVFAGLVPGSCFLRLSSLPGVRSCGERRRMSRRLERPPQEERSS